MALKTYIGFLGQVKGDGVSTTCSVNLLTDPVGYQLPSSGVALPFTITATILPTTITDPFSSDGQTPTMAFGLTHNIVNVTWPLAPGNGAFLSFGGNLYFS
jgi:hypothetical protein